MRILNIALILLLTGCSSLTAFDSTEYDRYITIKMTADAAIPECGSAEVKKSIDELGALISHQFVYASYRESRTQIGVATTEIAGLIANLQAKYKTGEPSVGYCQEKLKNISMGTTTILQTLGNM